MVFSSPIFLFLFLPAFLIPYFLIPHRARLMWILVGSWVFYASWRLDFLFLLILVSAVNWAAGLLIHARQFPPDRHEDVDGESGKSPGRFHSPLHRFKDSGARTILVLTIVFDLAVLALFKYAGFGLQAASELLGLFGLHLDPALEIILPVGISFYIFQALSYVVDVYRGDATLARSFIKLSAYLALFPQLTAGPIIRYKDLDRQLEEPHVSRDRAIRGLRRFIIGLAKKVIIADSLGGLIDAAYGLASPAWADAWLGMLAFSIQLYLDFSAYSDMALGLGLILGFRFRENFDRPYHSRSITEFWRRWHISLSNWLRDYLYIPLGGNRRGKSRTAINLMTVMVLGGLWHGAAWNFLVWGFWHGLFLLLERYFPQKSDRPGLPSLIQRLGTLIIVGTGWIFFRSPDLAAAFQHLLALLGLSGNVLSAEFAWQIRPDALFFLVLGLVYVVFERPVRGLSRTLKPGKLPIMHALGNTGLGLMFLLSVSKLVADSYSPFLYFRF